MSGYISYEVEASRENKKGAKKQPFPHQSEAFEALTNTFTSPIEGYKGSMLVLPTGGGKTFTAVNWLCRNIISKGIKVLWLAQSSYLLDQAAQTFKNEIHSITGRNTINLRVVSSSDHHSNAGSIISSDDIIVCTTQTAIRAYFTEAEDRLGNTRHTPFRKFVDELSESELFVVIDEAHHTPAFGCRNLLISLRKTMKNMYVLGLTATPFHNDKRISGWLWDIYDKEICYQADINVLQMNGILSVPEYIEKQTGLEFEVDDQLYNRLTSKHKDLPEHIIEKLANDSARNNYIVSDYVNNKENYGKTLIFADRWFQCEYIVEKLKSQGIRANAVYSKIEKSDKLFADGMGRRSNKDNEKIMQDFRQGEYEVIVNVKMLTEGVDVPDVKTVMITRQTTSPVLFTQMVGRALRGKKAGGGEDKDHANIVLFMDSWKRLLPFVTSDSEGKATDRTPRQGKNPIEIISTQLIKIASADIGYEDFGNSPYLSFIPVGWYAAEYTVSIEDSGSEEFIACMESIVVYDFNSCKYEELINSLMNEDLSKYANEALEDDDLLSVADVFFNRFFTEEDNLDGNLLSNIIKIIRHIAQNGNKPEFLNFNERNVYDLDKIAEELIDLPPRQCQIYLKNLFNNDGLLWKVLYRDFLFFKQAFDHAINRILISDENGSEGPIPGISLEKPSIVLTEELRQQVYMRDHYQCLCCGKERRKGVSLEIDHILPVAMGGKNMPSNLQTLCKHCNGIKGVNEIDYRSTLSPLAAPKEMLFFPMKESDDIENVIARIVNHIYHCKAFCSLEYSQRKNGKNYKTWIIKIYNGNNAEWLEKSTHKLLEYLNYELGWYNVENLLVSDL